MSIAEPILHVDMDAFYASVEVRERPELAGRPVLVGGTGGRGVVASASYEARAFGIRSAMPMARALRLCPHAVVVGSSFDLYGEVSAQLREIFESVTPMVEPLSLDEAFLDVSGSIRLFGEPVVIGELLRERIREELRLPASVGVAHNKFLAKLLSGKAKPDGLLHLPTEAALDYIAPLGVRDLWGVGAKTAERLEKFGIRTVAEVRAVPRDTMVRIVGEVGASHIADLAMARDPRTVQRHESTKGMGAEETFDADIDDPEVLRRELLRLSEKVSRRLRKHGVAGRTVTLKLRYANFSTITRSKTVDRPLDDATQLHRTVALLLDALRLERVRVRLVGVRVTNLVPAGAARQLSMTADDRWQQLERAADSARDRFGDGSVTRGALLDE
ncbi:DNA polymerase IV [Euzebya pacifica]|uniref:DNA polymerase IV n=1 Tax=Euzebya pacifica TaxID=1608957 RepID=A0A346XYY2_9ACTN|nr:DNA polymerase IV [Euzebya pacifica]AXV07429.1 DNA polymerase IV [Euzebya pacifica]